MFFEIRKNTYSRTLGLIKLHCDFDFFEQNIGHREI